MAPEIEAIGSGPVWPNWSQIIRVLNEELAGPKRPFELIQGEVRRSADGLVTLLLTPYVGGWMTESDRVVESQRGLLYGFTVAIVVAGASTFPDITIDVEGMGYLGRQSRSTITVPYDGAGVTSGLLYAQGVWLKLTFEGYPGLPTSGWMLDTGA